LDRVRDYFGERVAMYFCFVAHLHHWLVPAAAAGLLFWLWDALFAAGTADNASALPLCVGVCVWASTFVHGWRRTAAGKAVRWGTWGLKRGLEPTRPEFYGVDRVNPVTLRVDRYYPWSERIWKVICSYTVIAAALALLLSALSVMFALQHIFARIGARFVFQVLNAVFVDIMNGALGAVARRLTDLENHRSQTEYSHHLLAKTVVFKFVNCYASLFYIAFFKEHSRLLWMPMSCANDDCLSDLSSQLAIFMIVRLGLQSFVELGLPYLLTWYKSVSEGVVLPASFAKFVPASPECSRAEREFCREEHDISENMDEVLTLYGYAAMFAVACPWAPFMALLSSLVQCFLDQKKLVLLCRRPFPAPAADNEPWDTAFDVYSLIACVTNAGLAIFSTDAFDGWGNHQRVLAFIVLEHVALAARLAASVVLPAPPCWLRQFRAQQDAIVRKHFDLGGDDDDAGALAELERSGYSRVPMPTIFDDAGPSDEAEEVWR